MGIQSTGSLSDSEKPSSFQFGVWYPIESAPKDGTEIILFWPFITQDGFVTSGRWYDPRDAAAYWDSSLVNGGATPPTHWMPLPSPPGAELNFSDEPGSDAVSMMTIPSSKDLKGE